MSGLNSLRGDREGGASAAKAAGFCGVVVVAKATTHKDCRDLAHTLKPRPKKTSGLSCMLRHPSAVGHFCEGVFFVAVKKSFVICFQGFAKFLNSGVLRLEFFGCACGGPVWAKLGPVAPLCEYALRAAALPLHQVAQWTPAIR